MRVKKANTKQEVLSNIAALEELAVTDADKENLNRLKHTALNSVSLNIWLRRVFFGFSLTNAIERWLSAFNPSLDKPLGEQIPKEETTDVVTAWMRFLIYRGLLLLLLSSAITLVTAVFLYKQIQKQDELITVQVNAENQKNTFLYLQSLYDETCIEQTVKSIEDLEDNATIQACTPIHNARQRAEALKGYIQLRGESADLTDAHLENTNLWGFHFNGATLNGANLRESILVDTSLNGALLISTNLQGANLHSAYLQGTNFREASLQNAYFRGASLQNAILSEANLQGADLSNTDLSNIDLKAANFTGADIRDVDGLTCEMLKMARNWESAYRDEKLACGEAIPKPP